MSTPRVTRQSADPTRQVVRAQTVRPGLPPTARAPATPKPRAVARPITTLRAIRQRAFRIRMGSSKASRAEDVLPVSTRKASPLFASRTIPMSRVRRVRSVGSATSRSAPMVSRARASTARPVSTPRASPPSASRTTRTNPARAPSVASATCRSVPRAKVARTRRADRRRAIPQTATHARETVRSTRRPPVACNARTARSTARRLPSRKGARPNPRNRAATRHRPRRTARTTATGRSIATLPSNRPSNSRGRRSAKRLRVSGPSTAKGSTRALPRIASPTRRVRRRAPTTARGRRRGRSTARLRIRADLPFPPVAPRTRTAR